MRTPRLPVVHWTDAPRQFKWTGPFLLKTKSGYCARAFTYQLAPNSLDSSSIKSFEDYNGPKLSFVSYKFLLGAWFYWSITIDGLMSPIHDKLIQVTSDYKKVNDLFGVDWKYKKKNQIHIN